MGLCAALPTALVAEEPPARSRVVVVKQTDRAKAVAACFEAFAFRACDGRDVAVKANFNSADPFPASTHPATLGALLRRWPGRAFWLGFSAFGWSYFFLAFSSPRVRLSLPTTPPLVRLYDVFSGAGIARPEDVAPFILRLHDYLKVGHALIALAAALVGGIVLGCLAGWLGRAARPASSGPG